MRVAPPTRMISTSSRPRAAWLLPLAATLIVPVGCDDSETGTGAGIGGSGLVGAGAMGGDGGGAVGPGGTGGTGGTGAGGNVGGSGPGGTGGTGGGSSCTTISDELDDASTLPCWTWLHETLGEPAPFEVASVGTVPGHLIIEPYASGWYQDDRGPFLFKEVSGSFVVEVYAAGLDETDGVSAPTETYHSAGLLVRDPASITGNENWIMYNTGFQGVQNATTGTEGKTTDDSVSVLVINQGAHMGRLRICRVGDDFRLLRWLDGETGWTEEHQYVRADMPSTVQLGFITNSWPVAPNNTARNMQGRYDYLRYAAATDLADCTADITPE